MNTRKEVEDARLKEMIKGHEERLATGDATVEIVKPCADLEAVIDRTNAAAQLKGGAMMRLGERFLRETDTKLS